MARYKPVDPHLTSNAGRKNQSRRLGGPDLPTVCCGPRGLLDTQLLDAVAQRAKAHAQQFGGLGLVPAGLVQGIADGLLFHFFNMAVQRGLAQ